MKTKLALILAFASSCAFAGTASHESSNIQPTESSSGWWVRFTPYAWITATEGDAGLAGFEAPVDIGFDDTLNTLDMSFMAVIEAGVGRWSFGLDGIYGTFSQDVTTGGRLFKSGEFEQTQIILTPRVAFNLIQTPDYRMDRAFLFSERAVEKS